MEMESLLRSAGVDFCVADAPTTNPEDLYAQAFALKRRANLWPRTGFARGADASVLKPAALRCEYHVDPIGIDAAKPRLSWVLESDSPLERGQAQSGYQILVASSRELLDAGKGDLWDTGKISSDETIQIEYGGTALASNQQAFWKVRVWNAGGKASEYSAPATWTMGLLKADDWRAKWIGYDAPVDSDPSSAEEKALTFSGLKWIWTDEGDAREASCPWANGGL